MLTAIVQIPGDRFYACVILGIPEMSHIAKADAYVAGLVWRLTTVNATNCCLTRSDFCSNMIGYFIRILVTIPYYHINMI